jgi:alpha-beta hydrolase superfamily lysophospholipase
VNVWPEARTDVLGAPYEALDLPLGTDFEGPVSATLVRSRAASRSGQAVLYLPGYNDYFFHRHLSEFFTSGGIDFYALDIRKCGRSCKPHETRNLCRSLTDYFPEIEAAAALIYNLDGNEKLLLSGHSTGGLIAAIWLSRPGGSEFRNRVNGLFLNSPFLSSGVPRGIQSFLNPALRTIAGLRPAAAFPHTLSGRYCQSLHVDYGGEWEFNQEWKSTAGTKLRLGWLAAIHEGQRLVRAGLRIEVPILVMCGAASSNSKASLEEIRCSDSVLNVDSIFKLSTRLGENVTSVRIKDACHDVLLSSPVARESALATLDRWMTAFL